MIDWARAAELRDEVGAEDFDEVVDLFLSEVEECLERLDANSCAAQLEADLHFLKGCSLNLGFSTFAELCQKGETAASNGQTAAIDVAAIRTLFRKSKQEFDHSYATKVA